jgi:hypothetical protein
MKLSISRRSHPLILAFSSCLSTSYNDTLLCPSSITSTLSSLHLLSLSVTAIATHRHSFLWTLPSRPYARHHLRLILFFSYTFLHHSSLAIIGQYPSSAPPCLASILPPLNIVSSITHLQLLSFWPRFPTVLKKIGLYPSSLTFYTTRASASPPPISSVTKQ